MIELGIQVPICWGHAKAAKLGEVGDPEWEKYAKSRYNAGYVRDARVSPDTGSLAYLCDVPGATVDGDGRLLSSVELPDGNKVQTAIGEVSAKIVPNWRDGQGRNWKDPVAHLALVPLPVVMHQKGFAELGTDAAEDGAVYLGRTSLIELATGSPMPLPIKKPDEPEDDDALDDMDEEPEPAAAPPEPTPAAAPDSMDANFSAVVIGLAKPHPKGIHLAPGTTPENLVERLHSALHQCNESEGADDDEDEPEEMAGGQPEGEQPVEEQRPIMMSTLSDEAPAFRRMFEEKQNAYRAKMLRRVEVMSEAKGYLPFLPKDKADKFREAFGGYELSTTSEGETIEQKADIELSAWWDAYKGSDQFRKRSMKGAKRAERPDAEPDMSKAQQEAGDDLAGRVMVAAK